MAILRLRLGLDVGSRLASRVFLAILLLCVLDAQTLGFMHGIVHQCRDGGPNAVQATVAPKSVHREESQHGFDALFANHKEASDCRVFDAVAQQGAFISFAHVPTELAPRLTVQRLLACDFVARWAALFDARGPPGAN